MRLERCPGKTHEISALTHARHTIKWIITVYTKQTIEFREEKSTAPNFPNSFPSFLDSNCLNEQHALHGEYVAFSANIACRLYVLDAASACGKRATILFIHFYSHDFIRLSRARQSVYICLWRAAAVPCGTLAGSAFKNSQNVTKRRWRLQVFGRTLRLVSVIDKDLGLVLRA